MDEPRAPVRVTLPAALVRLFPGAPQRVEVDATTVRDVIEALDARWAGMRDRLCESTLRIRPAIRVYVAGERARLETRIESGAEVTIVTAIVGG